LPRLLPGASRSPPCRTTAVNPSSVRCWARCRALVVLPAPQTPSMVTRCPRRGGRWSAATFVLPDLDMQPCGEGPATAQRRLGELPDAVAQGGAGGRLGHEPGLRRAVGGNDLVGLGQVGVAVL